MNYVQPTSCKECNYSILNGNKLYCCAEFGLACDSDTVPDWCPYVANTLRGAQFRVSLQFEEIKAELIKPAKWLLSLIDKIRRMSK